MNATTTLSLPQHGLLLYREIAVERLAFAATVILAASTFWFSPRLPMADLPQHAAQVAVWHDLLAGTSKWEPLLYINYFTPYLIGYSLALLFSFVLPVSAALKVTLALAYVGFVAVCVALRRRLGGDPRLDWLFIPGFFGYAYLWGFYTFLVAAPVGLLFIVLAHRYADRPALGAGVVLVVADLALFFSHGLVFLFANAIGGIFLLLRSRRLGQLVSAALPYVAIGLWCLVYALVRLRFEGSAVGEPSEMVWHWDGTRLNFLIFSIDWPLPGGFSANWSFGPLLVLMLGAPLVIGARPNWRQATAFVPFAVTILVAVVVPDVALNTWFLCQRFALFLLPFYAMIFRAPQPVRRGTVQMLWLPVVCWSFLALYSDRLFAFARESTSFEEVLAVMQPGHRALNLVFDPTSAALNGAQAYWHFPLWYQAERGGFVEFNAAGFLPQVVRYRPERIPTWFAGQRFEWQHADTFDWTKHQGEIYRYYFVRSIAPLRQDYFPTGRCAPVLLKSAGNWSLFENVRCYSAAPAIVTRQGINQGLVKRADYPIRAER
jgi:hypothetical protein